MDGDTIHLTREQLYEQAWQRPMTALAKEYGLSNVGLAKAFKRLNIPIPGRGHWARTAAGQTLKRPPLPAGPKDQPNGASFRRPRPEAPLPPEVAEVRRRMEAERAPERRIVVPATLESPHKLVLLAQSPLKRAKDPRWLLHERSCLDIRVGPESLERALRIMDTLLKALEVRGLTVEVLPPEGNEPGQRAYHRVPSQTVVHVGQEEVSLALTEPQKQVDRATPRPAWQRAAGQPADPRKEYRFSGSLTLAVDCERYSSRGRRIRDGKSVRLEDKLNEVVACVLWQGERRRQQRLAREKAERDRQEAELRRAEQESRRRIEAVWVHDLSCRLDDWRTARDIRAFVDRVVAHRPPDQNGPWPAEGWVAWARRYADHREQAAVGRVAQEVRVPREESNAYPRLPSPLPLPTW